MSDDAWRLICGDCLDPVTGLASLADGSVDAMVTDPPAGIGFMGRTWDGNRGGRVQWVAWLASVMREALRVCKPGAHALVWAIPRTSHWTATALEDAGWEVRDVITHHFGTGFPKSLNAGAGRGTALKPASEHWILVRKPLVSTVAKNVAAHGTGALNVDACRIGTSKHVPSSPPRDRVGQVAKGDERGRTMDASGFNPNIGRWPANLVLSHSADCEQVGEREVPGDARAGNVEPGETIPTTDAAKRWAGWGTLGGPRPCGTLYGAETVPVWRCAPGCPVAELDRQSGVLTSGKVTRIYAPILQSSVSLGDKRRSLDPSKAFSDSGGASRFFYTAKPSTSERDAGLEGLQARTGGEATSRKDGSDGLKSPRAGAGRNGGRRNIHPTVKPIDLMRWLCRLITPPGGLVLDPFAGSGTTLIAALREGFRVIGIEREAEYVAIARRRIEEDAPLFNRSAGVR